MNIAKVIAETITTGYNKNQHFYDAFTAAMEAADEASGDTDYADSAQDPDYDETRYVFTPDGQYHWLTGGALTIDSGDLRLYLILGHRLPNGPRQPLENTLTVWDVNREEAYTVDIDVDLADVLASMIEAASVLREGERGVWIDVTDGGWMRTPRLRSPGAQFDAPEPTIHAWG